MSAMILRRTATTLFVVAILGSAVYWNQSHVHWRENVSDSYLFSYYGWCVSHGARPYLDIWDNKPPGIWWVHALAFGMLGESATVEWAVGGAALLLTLAAVVGIACRAFHPSFALPAAIFAAFLLTHLTYEFGSNRTEAWVCASETVAVWLAVGRKDRLGSERPERYPQSTTPSPHSKLSLRLSSLLAAGCIAGTAPWFKQSGFGAIAGITAYLLLSPKVAPQARLLRTAVFGGGLLLTQCAGIAALASTRSIAAAYDAVIVFNRHYFDIGDATWWPLGEALRIYRPMLEPLRLIAIFAGLSGVISLLAIGSRVLGRVRSAALPSARSESRHVLPPSAESIFASDMTRIAILFWLWLGMDFYLACVSVGRLGYHLMPVLPPAALLCLHLLALMCGSDGLWASIVRRPSRAALLVLILAAGVQAAATSRSEAAQCSARRPRDSAGTHTFFAIGEPYASQARKIQSLTSASDAIYVWGWSPGTYRFAYRRNSVRFGTIEKLGQLGERVRYILDEVRAGLRANPPAALAISTNDYGGVRLEAERGEPFGVWLVATYDDTGDFGGMHVLKRRN